MPKLVIAICALAVAAGCASAPAPMPVGPKRVDAVIQTNRGAIEIHLFSEQSPITVANFRQYAQDGHYDGTIFHRVIEGFMIQGGGYGTSLQKKSTRPPIENEADNGLKNRRGTLAMARTAVVDSATAQFFINTVDNDALDYDGPSSFGYAVFGRVVSGMPVVDAIETAETGSCSLELGRDCPQTPIVIQRVILR